MNPPNDAVVAVPTLAPLALSFALGQLGQEERPKGSNSGPMVDKYLASVGLKPGQSWCMAFYYWTMQEAARTLKVANPVPRTGGVLKCWNSVPPSERITKANARLNPELVRPGAQFVMDYGGALGHTGMVERLEGNVIHTIEGNSNDEGSREGYEVCRRTRHLTDALLKGFINYK